MNIFDTQIGSSMNVTTTLAQFNKYIKTHAVQGPQGEIGPQGLQGNVGPQGIQGEQGPRGVGISNITTGTPTYGETTTTTPVIVNLTNGDQQTLNITAKNGADGSGATLYEHHIYAVYRTGTNTVYINLLIINKSPIGFNDSTFPSFINSNSAVYPVTGYGNESTNNQVLIPFTLSVSGVYCINIANNTRHYASTLADIQDTVKVVR